MARHERRDARLYRCLPAGKWTCRRTYFSACSGDIPEPADFECVTGNRNGRIRSCRSSYVDCRFVRGADPGSFRFDRTDDFRPVVEPCRNLPADLYISIMSAYALKTMRDALKRGTFDGAYYICGEDDFQKEDAMRQLIAAAIEPAMRDFNMEVRHAQDSMQSLWTLRSPRCR